MAKVDYWDVENEIAAILRAHESMYEVTVLVEPEMTFSSEMTPWLGIYMESRMAPSGQSLSAGRKQRYILDFRIWVWCFSLDVSEAIQRRNSLVGVVELVLMGNRTLNDKVDMSWIEGGRLPSARLPQSATMDSGILSGGEIILKADVSGSL